MRYALLIYGVSGAAAPGALAEERPAEAGGPSGDGVFDDWVAYTRALKRAGVLVGADAAHPPRHGGGPAGSGRHGVAGRPGGMSDAPLERAFREEWTAVVATLARRLGDLQAAEDATQEAFAAAALAWPRDGVPPKPGAWLTVTAWRKALGQLRHDRLFVERVAKRVVDLQQPTPAGEDVEGEEQTPGMEDDRLRLIFACCHPALALEVRVALTLRYAAGLTTREIANGFLVPEPTMAQRLVRA